MTAKLIARSKEIHDDGSIVEIVVWELPEPVPPCQHLYKYRLYYGANGVCRVRYDNERGKGDHKHLGNNEVAYTFSSVVDQLLDDFEDDITNWRDT